MIAGTYFLKGEPVQVLAQWRTGEAKVYEFENSPVVAVVWLTAPKATGPRNVLLQRADGSRIVRPFRGLRKAGPRG